MSGKVDNRAVEMQFNNKQFENGISSTLKSLDDLKKGLNLEGAAKGFSGITDAANKVSLSGMANSISTLENRFSAMGIVAITAIQNIANSAIEAGKTIVKALTVDPVKMGFQEYELKMGAIQTIMAGTGESLGKVNEKLNELNTYSDKTIYSFSDMTSNIGKFTNAGVKLDDAVAAIQGIANAAAVSGSNAEEASRAMYNFGQSIASGSVKLIDWKSIELANMATVEFKQQLIDTALKVGTLVKVEGGYISTTKNAKGEVSDLLTTTKGFNDSLQAQWMTADVLTSTLKNYSDETTAIGKKATAAATEVKTLTMMYSTLKEAAQSGWAQTWEILVGDFNEGKELWTSLNNVIGGFIANQAKARNELLQGWKDLGGRTALIDAFRNAFEAIGKILAPIHEAFRDIFPPMTAKTLYDMTISLRDFTEKLQISEQTAYKIRQTFRVLFGALALGRDIFMGLAGGIIEITKALFSGESMVPAFKNMISGIVDSVHAYFDSLHTEFADVKNLVLNETVANVKEVLSKMGESIKKTFEDMTQAVKNFYQSISDGAKTAGSNLMQGPQGSLDVFRGKLEEAEKALYVFHDVLTGPQGLGGSVEFTKFGISDDFLAGVADAGAKLRIAGQQVKEFFITLKDGFAGGSTSIDSSGFMNRVSVIGDGLRKFGEALRTVWDKIKEIAGPFGALVVSVVNAMTKLFDALGRSFDENGTQTIFDLINSGIFATMALTISRFVKVMLSLSKSADEFVNGLTKVLEGTKGVLKGYQQDLQAGALEKIAIAIGLLALSLIALSMIDPKKLGIAAGAITALFAELVAAMAMMTKVATGTKGKDGILEQTAIAQMTAVSIGVIGLSVAMLLLAHAMKQLAGLSWADIGKGIAGITIMMTGLVLAINKMMGGGEGKTGLDSEKMMKLSVTLIAFAASIKILAGGIEKISGVVNKIGSMDPATIMKGMTGILMILGQLYAFLKYADFSKMGWEAAGALAIFAIALDAIVLAISGLGRMDPAQLTQGLVAITSILGQIVLFNLAMGEKRGLAESAKGLLAMAGAILILAIALRTIANMKAADIAKGMATMSLMLTGLVVASQKLDTINPAGLIAMAGALLIMAVALKLLSTIPMTGLIIGLVGLAGVIGLMVAAGYLLEPVVAVFEGMGVAMLLLGGGLFLAGAGMALFASGLAIVVGLGAAAGAAIALMVKQFVELIPTMAVALAKGLVSFITTLAEYAPDLIKSVVEIIEAILKGLTEILPKLLEFIGKLLDGIIKLVNDYIDPIGDLISRIINKVIDIITNEQTIKKIVNGGLGIINAFLQGIKDNLDKKDGIVATVGDIIAKFIEQLGLQVVKISEAAMRFLIDVLNGIANAIRNNTSDLVAAVKNLLTAVIDLFKSMMSMFVDLGKDILRGIISGVTAIAGELGNALVDAGKKALGALTFWSDSYSPSKLFAKEGNNWGNGIVVGIKETGKSISAAAVGMGEGAVAGVNKGLSAMKNQITMGVDVVPTIRPVVDMTDVQNGIDSTFKNQPTIKVGAGKVMASDVATSPKVMDMGMQQKPTTDTSVDQRPLSITFHNTVRDDTDIRKISQELQTTIKRYGMAKGVLV